MYFFNNNHVLNVNIPLVEVWSGPVAFGSATVLQDSLRGYKSVRPVIYAGANYCSLNAIIILMRRG